MNDKDREAFEASAKNEGYTTNSIGYPPYARGWQAARAHYANNPDKPARNLGGVMLGAKTTDYFI